LGQAGEVEGLRSERAVTEHHAVAQVVKAEEARRDGKAPPLTLAEFAVNHDLHESPFAGSEWDLTT